MFWSGGRPNFRKERSLTIVFAPRYTHPRFKVIRALVAPNRHSPSVNSGRADMKFDVTLCRKMPTLIECYHGDDVITIEDALHIKRSGSQIKKGDFTCIECRAPVKAHKAGTGSEAHFEHFARNADCAYSHPNNLSNYKRPDKHFELDDKRAIEGYERDKKTLSYARNASLAKRRKEKDGHTCQACGFFLRVEGRFIIECHHTIQVSEGEREVSISDLVSLCPTCHRIAHTRDPMYAASEIAEIMKNKRGKSVEAPD